MLEDESLSTLLLVGVKSRVTLVELFVTKCEIVNKSISICTTISGIRIYRYWENTKEHWKWAQENGTEKKITKGKKLFLFVNYFYYYLLFTIQCAFFVVVCCSSYLKNGCN